MSAADGLFQVSEAGPRWRSREHFVNISTVYSGHYGFFLQREAADVAAIFVLLPERQTG